MKRLLASTCILFWVVAGKAESIDQRKFALDTFSPTPNDVRVAEKRVQTYWNKHKAQYGANTRYLAAGAILSGDVLDLWPKLINSWWQKYVLQDPPQDPNQGRNLYRDRQQ